MSLFADNPIVRFLDALLGKVKLAALLTEDLFNFVFPPENSDRLQKLLYLLGINYLAYRAGKSLYSIYRNCGWMLKHASYARKFNGEEFRMRYGGVQEAWALVTGFSVGIGFTYACELAKLGFNLVLIDWQKERAESSERWIKQRNSNICTKVIILDLTSDPSTIRSVLEAETSDIDVSLIINNAGVATPGLFEKLELKSIVRGLRVNLMAVVQVTRTFLPRMRKRYNRSGIINMASAFSQFPSPNVGVYNATKQFVRIFTKTLYLENTDKIDILCVKPLGVLTGMMEFRRNILSMVAPIQVVKQSLYELGEVPTTFGAVEHKFLTTYLKSMNREELMNLYNMEFIKAQKI